MQKMQRRLTYQASKDFDSDDQVVNEYNSTARHGGPSNRSNFVSLKSESKFGVDEKMQPYLMSNILNDQPNAVRDILNKSINHDVVTPGNNFGRLQMIERRNKRYEQAKMSKVSQSVNLGAFTITDTPSSIYDGRVGSRHQLNSVDLKQRQNKEILKELKKQRAAMRLHQINQ